ncbi:hypothetical protein [Tautonia marina]|uniref:hypothetical protein n=1 Tax=Tautonia marina TaxID=2653855 RepID=UPI001260A1D7|nr:hypothetical protein [Tautonia marina]
MSVVNSKKKTAPTHNGFEWAGAMARIRRGGVSARSGRRSLLLGALTASYANTGRTGRRSAEPRTASSADRS